MSSIECFHHRQFPPYTGFQKGQVSTIDRFNCTLYPWNTLNSRFLGSDNPATYFSNTQRTRIVHEILEAAAYGKRKHGEVGVGRLVEDLVYTATFPLHEATSRDTLYHQLFLKCSSTNNI